MDKPKETNEAVGTQQVVRDLVDALKSLQKKPELLNSSAPAEPEPQTPPARPAESQAGRSKATTHLDALPAGSEAVEATPERTAESNSAGNSAPPDFHAKSSPDGIIQGYCRVHRVVERLQVTPQELQTLSDASLLGSLACKDDVLFMLRQIREASDRLAPRATVAAERSSVADLSGASLFERSASRPSSMSGNKHEVEADNRAPFVLPIAAQTAPPEDPEPRAAEAAKSRSGARIAITLSIVSLVLWVLTMGVVYKLVDAYRKHVATIATLAAIISSQREMSEQTISQAQAQAAAAKLASQTAQSLADNSNTQVEGSRTLANAAKEQADSAALSARSARDLLLTAEAADVNVDAIYCSPPTALSLNTKLTLRYRNSGRTPADNFDSSIYFGIPPASPTEQSPAPAIAVSAASISAGARMSGGTTATVSDVLSKGPGGVPAEQTFQKILAGQQQFAIWGSITYTDVLKEKRQKNFEYVWDSNFPKACLFTEAKTPGQ